MTTSVSIRFLLSAALVLDVAVPAFGKSDELVTGGVATVVEIVDGDTLCLDDGEQVQSLGLHAPKLPLGRPNFKTWPLGNESKDALAHLALGKRLHLGFGGRKPGWHGWGLANLHAENVTCV